MPQSINEQTTERLREIHEESLRREQEDNARIKVSLDNIRQVTKRMLTQMNGALTSQEKTKLLNSTSDQQLFDWFQGEANGNLNAYLNLLILQGPCDPSKNR